MQQERFYFVVSALVGLIWGPWWWLRHGWNTKAHLRLKTAQEAPSILVVRMDEIGDMVTTLPMLRALRDRYPHARLEVWCQPLAGSLLETQPYVDKVWQGARDRPSHHRQGMSYHWILECRGNWGTLNHALLSGARYRRDRGLWRMVRKVQGKPQRHEWDLNFLVAGPLLGIRPRQLTQDAAAWYRKYQGPPGQSLLEANHTGHRNAVELFVNRHALGNYVVFHAGARKMLRRWSLASWAELATRLHREYSWDVLFVGTPEEQGDLVKIKALLNHEVFEWMDGGPIAGLLPLLAGARLMVGNESGPMHLASASGCPTVGLFGPGEPEIFSPKSDSFKAIHIKLPCNPCGQVRCVFPDNPCMNRISVDLVMQTVYELVGRPGEHGLEGRYSSV
jgi:ADP-heptose:LPS heptosyltransferase